MHKTILPLFLSESVSTLITKVNLQYFCLSLRFFLSFSLSPSFLFSLARSFIDDAVCAHNPKDDDVKQINV